MAVMVPFTSNYEDQSNEMGYQFEFRCQRCGNGYASTFQTSATNIGGGLLRTAGGMLGGLFGAASSATESLAEMTRGVAHDKALTKAVEEMRPHFHQCHRCGEWVCKPVCWNEEAGLCVRCAPKLQGEIASARSQAQTVQVQERLASMDLLTGVDLKSNAPVICPACHKETEGGKFCSNCGSPLNPVTRCPQCNNEVKAGAKFCPECGHKM